VPDSVPAAETVRKCFAFDPRERPTASELADALAPQGADVVGSTALLQLEALQAECAAYKQAAEAALEAASSRLVESESLVAELTGRISALPAENEAPKHLLWNTQVESSPSWLGGDFLALPSSALFLGKQGTLDGTAVPRRFSAFQLRIPRRITATALGHAVYSECLSVWATGNNEHRRDF
jgi:hypothetical protein